jgi:hypothetical protein
MNHYDHNRTVCNIESINTTPGRLVNVLLNIININLLEFQRQQRQ